MDRPIKAPAPRRLSKGRNAAGDGQTTMRLPDHGPTVQKFTPEQLAELRGPIPNEDLAALEGATREPGKLELNGAPAAELPAPTRGGRAATANRRAEAQPSLNDSHKANGHAEQKPAC